MHAILLTFQATLSRDLHGVNSSLMALCVDPNMGVPGATTSCTRSLSCTEVVDVNPAPQGDQTVSEHAAGDGEFMPAQGDGAHKRLLTRRRSRKGSEDTIDDSCEKFPMWSAFVDFLFYGTILALQMVRWLRFGGVAIWLSLRLVAYALLLLPVFLRIGYNYFHDPRIRRRIRFGPKPRNFLAMYCPAEAEAAVKGQGPPVPVVFAVMGGAWIIGHRQWNAQLGMRMMDAGVIFVSVDYRNFPFARIPDMVEDLTHGFSWVVEHIGQYGGDIHNMIVMGQSAGAHLASLMLLQLSVSEARALSDGKPTLTPTLPIKEIKGFLGVSGPYDLVALEPHLDSRGLYSRILRHLCIDGDLAGCSPARIFDTPDWQARGSEAAEMLPPFLLFHGEVDKSVPSSSTTQFADKLREAGVPQVVTDVRTGMSHTDPIIEGPMRGQDIQVRLILSLLYGTDFQARVQALPRLLPMAPEFILNIAAKLVPF